MRQRILSSIFVLLAAALGCEAKTPPEPRVVDLTATDGVHLKATYFPAGKPGPGVILLHQCNQQRKNWDDLAGRLAIAGINVLTLDYRGYGDSEGPRALELSNEDRTRMMSFFRFALTSSKVAVCSVGATPSAIQVPVMLPVERGQRTFIELVGGRKANLRPKP